MSQIVMVSLEDLVPSTHVYRKLSSIWNFSGLSKTLKSIDKDNNYGSRQD